MLMNTVLYNSADHGKQIDGTQHYAEVNLVQTNEALHSATDREMQSDNTRYLENNEMNTTTTLNIGESGRPEDEEVSNHRGNIRFALDKVSSGNDEVFNTKGGLEIGPQDSAL